jgi:hypothetical protein
MPQTPVKKGQKPNLSERSVGRSRRSANRSGRSARPSAEATIQGENGELRKERSRSRLRRVFSETNLRDRFVPKPSVREMATLPKPYSEGSQTKTDTQGLRSQTFPQRPTQNSAMDHELRRYFSNEQLSAEPPSRLTQITSVTSASSAVEPGVRLESKVELSSSDDESTADYIRRRFKEVKNPFQKKKK